MKVADQLRRFRTLDWPLLIVALLLSCFGLAAIYSLSIHGERVSLGAFLRQLTAFIGGVAILGLIAASNYRRLRAFAPVLGALAVALLVGVLVFGTIVRGTRGWFVFFGQSFQPVEFAKLAFLLLLARYLADEHDATPAGRLGGSLVVLAIFIVPVLLQPDIGSALLFVVVWLGMLLLSGIPRSYMVRLFLVLVILAGVGWFLLPPAQQGRVITFLNPTLDPLGSGYNVRQSIVAVGSGQFFGRGLGLGPQSQLKFLPTAQTDFIFAVIGEELGFVGSMLLLGFFSFFLLRLARHLDDIPDRFGRLVVAGALILFTTQVLENIGMNMGLAPVTGIPLPFVSYGGSALLFSLAVVGIVESVIRQRRQGAIG